MQNIAQNLVKELDAYESRIVTRFPPEPSGCLHLGHAKAIFINANIARHYDGIFILRFDDTNPRKESNSFVEQILHDIDYLHVIADKITHTSDYFNQIIACADRLISIGLAYVDDSDNKTIKSQRRSCTINKNRDMTVDQCATLWNKMQQGLIVNSVLRIKLDMMSTNGAMRDPIIFRFCDVPHFITGNKFKVYPTYDFACPIVDSIEGVTHVFRSNEFLDRDEQYNAILSLLDMRSPVIHSYSKLNFNGAFPMKKREIRALIEAGQMDGWNDPRLLTIQGSRRRGLTLDGLRTFLNTVKSSNTAGYIDVSALWHINKTSVFNISTRYIAILKNDLIEVNVIHQNDDQLLDQKDIDRFVRNKGLGTRPLYYSNIIYLSKSEWSLVNTNEEITLMNWGNMIRLNDTTLLTNLKGNHKTTKHKLLWLYGGPNHCIVTLKAISYTNQKIINDYIGEPDTIHIKSGDFVQLMKSNFYICDFVDHNEIILIEIPTPKDTGQKN